MTDIELRKRLSFQEAEGAIPLPSQLNWGQLDARLRARLWRVFYELISNHITSHYPAHALIPPVKEILHDEHVENRFLSANSFSSRSSSSRNDLIGNYEAIFMKGQYSDVFGFVQYFLRHENCPPQLLEEVSGVLAEVGGAYQIVTPPPTIVPIVTQEEKDAISSSLTTVAGSTFGGAQEHLRAASAALSEGRHGDCVRESVHAVESAVRKLTGKNAASLSAALPELEKYVPMHPALKEAVNKLYGYTSDEKGVRHALTDGPNPAYASGVGRGGCALRVIECSGGDRYRQDRRCRSGALVADAA